jgi:hypothetical protein
VVRSEHLSADDIEFLRWRAERWIKMRHFPAALAHSPWFVLRNGRRMLAHTFTGTTLRSVLGLERQRAVFERFRTRFVGKSSPVHFFWGSFDLAVTRFSGRGAPLHPGGVPHLADSVTREAYSHEVSSAGFWPGGPGHEEAAFYSYAYPVPEGFAQARVSPSEAYFDSALGEFLLPYDAVRNARDPDAALLDFLESTYSAAADLAQWDRSALECEEGRIGQPRRVL